MNCYAIPRPSTHCFAGVLATATAVVLLLAAGGAALAQSGDSGRDSPVVIDQLRKYADELAARNRESAERQVQLHAQLKQLESENVSLQSQLAGFKQRYQVAEQELTRVAREQAQPSIKVFRLRHARADTLAEMLGQVYGKRLRAAVDGPSNTLIVSSDPNALAATEQLVSTLDTPPEGAPPGPEAERTLQLRILWLMDKLPDDVGTEPDERYVSPMVVDTLHSLGLAHPKIVCQHVSTLSTQPKGKSKFDFQDPIMVGDMSASMEGDGLLSTVEGDRYRIELHVITQDDDGAASEMAGSLVMPLEHYVVLGTTNYITAHLAEGNNTYPTAFVVFLQEAPIAHR